MEEAFQPDHGPLHVSVLTAGRDKPYALGLASALMARGIRFDFIGSDEVNGPELHDTPLVTFLNLRGDQREDSPLWRKMARVLVYYGRLLKYAAVARPAVFHILWNNKFEWFDRTVLMLYYRLLGKKIAFTAHNVNAGERDSKDHWLNRLSLGIQYRLAHHIFVHTEKMRRELVNDFGARPSHVSVIPFGINNTLPTSALGRDEARCRLGMGGAEKAVLFFGNIAPYKGLEYLVDAFTGLSRKKGDYRLIIAGRPKGCAEYWEQIHRTVIDARISDRVVLRTEYIPDGEVELYFKAADVLVLPYVHIFQSGVLFLGYSFGLPVIATDVGSLREEIVEGRTGFIARSRDSDDIARTIEKYFASELYRELEDRRADIRAYANDRYSWAEVAQITENVYGNLLHGPRPLAVEGKTAGGVAERSVVPRSP